MKLPDRHFHVAQMWRTIVPRRGKLSSHTPNTSHSRKGGKETKGDFQLPFSETREEDQQRLQAGRVLCVLIPRFGLALQSREDPHLLLHPAVLTEDNADTALVLEVNGKAAKSGVATGMTAAQAGTLCTGLIVKSKDSAGEERAMQELLTLLQTIAPLIKVDTPGVFFVAAEGFDTLYGGEQSLAERVIRAIREFGVVVQVGIGDNPFVARLSAELTRPFSLQSIPLGATRNFLDPLKIKHLPVAEETQEQLLALGIRTIGQIAAFPANELVARFGADGALIAHLARGDDPRHFVPLPPEEDLSERLVFDNPYDDSSLLLNLAEQAITPLFARLAQRGLGCCRLAVRLSFANRSQQVLELAVDKPTLSWRKLRRQLLLQLESARFQEAVVEIAVAPLLTAPLSVRQLDLTARVSGATTTPRAFEQRILRASLFRIGVCSAVVPEASYSLTPFNFDFGAAESPSSLLLSGVKGTNTPSGPESSAPAFAMSGITGLRTFQPVRRIEVISENDQPRSLIINRQRRRIVRCHGPWQISGQWWRDTFVRDYFEVETEHAEVYLIYRLASPHVPDTTVAQGKVGGLTSGKPSKAAVAAWYLQGVFD